MTDENQLPTQKARAIPIAEATLAQLREFAQTHLGIELPPTANTAQARSQVRQAWAKDEIYVLDEPESEQAKKPTARLGKQTGEGKVRLMINRTEEPGGDEPVPIGVNGRIMLVPRGEEVEIPRPYFLVLRNAIKHVYDMHPNGKELLEKPREVPMYPFQVFGGL